MGKTKNEYQNIKNKQNIKKKFKKLFPIRHENTYMYEFSTC